MTDAPIPPHERTWRHPSELAPTAAALEPSSTRSRLLAFSSGAVAAVLVAVMVMSVTPRRSNAPSAISATTTPPAAVLLRSPATISITPASDDLVRVGHRGSASGFAAALVGAPTAISTAPTADPSDLDAASRRPGVDERVIVLTSSFTYDVAWGDVNELSAPAGSIVMTYAGELLATFVDGGLQLLFD